jgi:hypothetical protein
MSLSKLLAITLFIALGVASIAVFTTTFSPQGAYACDDGNRTGNCK